MIGGLQGDFGDLDIKYLKQNISKCRSHIGDLDIKYLKQNISKCRSHISGSFRRTPWHCAKWLRNSPSKRYQRIWIWLTGEVETPSSPIRRQAPDAKYPNGMSAEKIPNVKHPGGMSAAAEFRMWTSGWNGSGSRISDVNIRVEWRQQQNSGCDTSG